MSSIANSIPVVVGSTVIPAVRDAVARDIDRYAGALRAFDGLWRAIDRVRPYWSAMSNADRAQFERAARLWSDHHERAGRILPALQGQVNKLLKDRKIEQADVPLWIYRAPKPAESLGAIPVVLWLIAIGLGLTIQGVAIIKLIRQSNQAVADANKLQAWAANVYLHVLTPEQRAQVGSPPPITVGSEDSLTDKAFGLGTLAIFAFGLYAASQFFTKGNR